MKGIRADLAQPHFGLHVTIDAYGCRPEILNSRRETARFLDSAVRKLQMKKIYGPAVVRAPGNEKKDPGGYSGFVMIQESHFSAHTFPKRKFVSVDVYSCTDFDFLEIVRWTGKFFSAQSLETNVIVRGKRYPLKNLL